MAERLVVIDGNSLMNRAYYAMQRPMITHEGIYTQGIYGFLNMLSKITSDYEPDYIAIAWDKKAPTFRHKEYDAYKAGRRKMPPELAMEFPLIKDIMKAMNIAQLEIEGFEADDIIGTLAKDGEEKGLEPLIITGDKDALQLASDKTKVIITRKGISEFDIYDREAMIKRYELTPEQFIDLKGLMGDQSDNIPGIPGVGEKTGIKLLKEFGSVENLVSSHEDVKPDKLREKVENNMDLALMSKRLATIVTNVPIEYDIEDLRYREPDLDALVDIYSKLELNSFLKKLHVSGAAEIPGKETSLPKMEEFRKKMIERAELKDIKAPEDGLYIHVFGNDDHVNDPVVYGIAILSGMDYYYLPVREEADIDAFISYISDNGISVSGHQLSSSAYMLIKHGLSYFKAKDDSEIGAYLLDPSRSGYEIKVLVLEEFHKEIMSDKDFKTETAQTDLLGNNDPVFSERGFEVLYYSKALTEAQRERISDTGMLDLYRDVEIPLIGVLASMEAAGIQVDASVLGEIGDEIASGAKAVETEIYDLAEEEFNINSPRQLGDILFDKLGLPAGKKTKSGYSTSADILEKLREKHPIIDKVLEYRTLTKLKSTYVDGLIPLIGPDKRIHCHFQQTVAATGRLSCTEPNLQNIPVRQELGRRLRKAFISGDGKTFVGADYSQIELRLMAHLSGDDNLIGAFNNGEDIHRKTASRVFNIDYDKVTKLDRSRAKAVNFGIIYGMSGFGLSQDIHVSRKDAEKYIEDYFEKHPKVKAYLDEQIDLARERTYSETLLGRRRYIHELGSSNFMVRKLGERLAMNSPIQGSAADIIKIAMIKVFDELKKRGLRSRLILQIHDELIIETVSDEEEEVRELLKRNMESAAELKVKLICDMNSADSWYDLK